MATIKVTDRELQSILTELENDLDGYLTDTQAKLSKAREEDASPSAGMGALSASASSPSASGASPSASAGSPSASMGSPSPSAGGEEGAGAPPMEGAPEGAEGAPEGMEGAPEGAEGAPEGAEGPVDPAALEAEYAKLPLPELQAHYLAAKAALFSAMGQGQGASPSAPPPAAPPAGPSAGAPPAGPSAGAPPMAMSEKGAEVKGVGDGSGEMSKSEVEDLKAQVAEMSKIVSLFVGQPIRKAVTNTSYVAKSEVSEVETKSITPAQITAKLSELTRKPDLKKSDRDLVTGYYEGTVKVDAIAHLLK